MVLTRAVDNRLKQFFTSGEVQFGDVPFQGKGFRSLGQEAIYAAAHPPAPRRPSIATTMGGWQGDVVGPMIRDLGVALAMRGDARRVRMVLNAQMGKAGPPMNGKDLHIGDFEWGILPAAAPLAISTLTLAGHGDGVRARRHRPRGRLVHRRRRHRRSASGTRRSTCAPRGGCRRSSASRTTRPRCRRRLRDQSAVRVFADKAVGYGIPGITVDGTDPDAIAAAFTWAADRARDGHGPALIELVSHAHVRPRPS